MSFAERSRDVARRFIRTALVVDDRAFRDAKPDEERPHGGLIPPVGSRPTETQEEPEPAPPGTPEEHPSTQPQPEADTDRAHALDAEQLIRDFAASNVFCTVIGVEKQESEDRTIEELAAHVLPLAHKADVLVTDWVLFSGGSREGGAATNLILRAVKEAEAPERFRLILVYTGTPDLRDIARTITQKLNEAELEASTDDAGYTVTCGAVRIAVYAKPDALLDESTPGLDERVVSYDRLVERVVEECASVTAGLVSNAALAALAAVRDNTHRLLRTFRPELDAPYLAHRAMLPTPDDAEDYVVQLIANEIRSVIEDDGIEQEVSLLCIADWLREHESEMNFGALFANGSVPSHVNGREIAEALLRLGTGKAAMAAELELLGVKKRREDVEKYPHKVLSLTRAFIISTDADVEAARRLDHNFAALTSLRTRYGDAARTLTAGVVVRVRPSTEAAAGEGNHSDYRLCIQPLCDSARLSGRTQFPFLPLKPIDRKPLNEQRTFALVVPSWNDYAYFMVSYRPRDLTLVTFEPTGDRVLFTRDDGGDEWFVTEVDGSMYEYIAVLKPEQANRVLVRFAHQAARPGLDESEWLRRWTT